MVISQADLKNTGAGGVRTFALLHHNLFGGMVRAGGILPCEVDDLQQKPCQQFCIVRCSKPRFFEDGHCIEFRGHWQISLKSGSYDHRFTQTPMKPNETHETLPVYTYVYTKDIYI